MTFQPGNKLAVGGRKDRPFREALQMEITAAGEDHKRLRRIARALLEKASSGDLHAIQQVADRLDGRPAQAVDIKHDATDAFGQLWAMISAGVGNGVGSSPPMIIEHQSDQDVTH